MATGYLLNHKDRNAVNQTIDYVRRNAMGGSNNHHRNTATGSSSGTNPVVALITGGNASVGFSVTLYANGVDQAATGTATNVPAVDMASEDSACVGSYVPLYPSTITLTAWEEGE